jgi:hypothetical protein
MNWKSDKDGKCHADCPSRDREQPFCLLTSGRSEIGWECGPASILAPLAAEVAELRDGLREAHERIDATREDAVGAERRRSNVVARVDALAARVEALAASAATLAPLALTHTVLVDGVPMTCTVEARNERPPASSSDVLLTDVGVALRAKIDRLRAALQAIAMMPHSTGCSGNPSSCVCPVGYARVWVDWEAGR